MRKSWDELSEDYRKRLLRGGIGPAEHTRGDTLHGARGHGTRDKEAYDRVLKTYAKDYADQYHGPKVRPGQTRRTLPDIMREMKKLPPKEGLKLIREQRQAEKDFDKGRIVEARRRWLMRDKNLPDWMFYYHGAFS